MTPNLEELEAQLAMAVDSLYAVGQPQQACAVSALIERERVLREALTKLHAECEAVGCYVAGEATNDEYDSFAQARADAERALSFGGNNGEKGNG